MSDELESLITQLRRAGIPYAAAVQAFRKQFIWTLLVRLHGNQGKVAKALGVHRNTLKRMFNELGIDANEVRGLKGSRHQTSKIVGQGSSVTGGV